MCLFLTYLDRLVVGDGCYWGQSVGQSLQIVSGQSLLVQVVDVLTVALVLLFVGLVFLGVEPERLLDVQLGVQLVHSDVFSVVTDDALRVVLLLVILLSLVILWWVWVVGLLAWLVRLVRLIWLVRLVWLVRLWLVRLWLVILSLIFLVVVLPVGVLSGDVGLDVSRFLSCNKHIETINIY